MEEKTRIIKTGFVIPKKPVLIKCLKHIIITHKYLRSFQSYLFLKKGLKMLRCIIHYLQQTNIVWKTALASTISWDLAKLAGSQHPFLAPLTVILCLQPTLDKSVRYTYQRVFGTVVGVLLTAFIAPYLKITGWSIGLLILISAGIAKWMKVPEQVIKQMSISVLLVLALQSQSPAYAWDRIKDTLIGALVTIFIHLLIFPPDLTKKALYSMEKFADDLSERFSMVAKWIEYGCVPKGGDNLQNDAKKLFEELIQIITELNQASKNLKYNIFAQKSQTAFNQHNEQLLHLRQGYAHLTKMIQTFTEWSSSGNMTRENQILWSNYLQYIAVHIKNWKERINDNVFISEKLTAPFTLPAELEHHRYHLGLYNDALQIIQDFK
jgi:uncharacterized membrane protein YgaE (UPF0421/DUF939 family)